MALCTNPGAIGTVPEALDLTVQPGTRHHTLLTTNQPPEDSDTPFIQAVVSESDPRLAYLEAEIAKLQDQLKPLEEERLSLLTYRAQNRAILSPIRRIPPEILSDIFWWTLPPIEDARQNAPYEAHNIPWLLTHISSRWRAICIATPSLWSRIVVNYVEIHQMSRSRRPSSAPHLALIATQIQRSRKLKIHFYGSPEMDSRPQIQMFELLMQHSSRWEELSLGLTTEIFPLLISLHDRLPSLERLWVQWDGVENSSDKSLDCFQTVSSLVEFGVVNEFRDLPIHLPAPQLTRYELNGPWSTHQHILRGAPNLVEAHIHIDFDLEIRSDSVIELRRLRRLYISDSTSTVLSVLKAPALEELAVFLVSDGQLDFLDCLRGFVDRSLCRLRRLCLRGFSEPHTTTQILNTFLSITELVIIFATPHDVNALISALCLTEGDILAPQLESLFFGCETDEEDSDPDSNFDFTALPTMLKGRWEAENCALEHAALMTHGNPPLDPLTLSGLHALRQDGLHFLLSENARELANAQNAWTYGSTWN
ncbi:F-box domain-containing protein [Mycena sanguinolenta]|uniref:F-box domain-containing protein n=1 Tax=Mycena sanguinolenta TaxID=230812 RepID=A0A8H6Z515_9AGAR|nr:F-box domain-containing protein [Mycena sanguinolenta]